MFISTLDLFKIGIGPSSSHTMGPMSAAVAFRNKIKETLGIYSSQSHTLRLRCILKGSLAYTGIGHGTDGAVILGLHGYTPQNLAFENVAQLLNQLKQRDNVQIDGLNIQFLPDSDIDFDKGEPLPEHPNGMILQLLKDKECVDTQTYFSIGGGFIHTLEEINCSEQVLTIEDYPYPFDSAALMLQMAEKSGLSIAQMKRVNEEKSIGVETLDSTLDEIWQAMERCVDNGLANDGQLPGGLNVERRAKALHQQLNEDTDNTTLNDWLCAYAMAVNEENAAGHLVVTAPTNGAAGVIPAVLYYFVKHRNASRDDIHNFLLTAAAIGGLIKHRSSISGAEVGCQGEVGSAAAMAAAGLCAVLGGSPSQIENAAEIALEHHLGMTCDPVAGLVQVPCIERNGFGAIKAYTAAMLAKRGSGHHIMPLDNCISAMKQTGLEMSEKYKETSLGGLAVNLTEC